MLILTRRRGQRIIIGDGIIVEIVNVAGHGVSIGIDASREIPVHRLEVFERKQLEAAARAEAVPQPDPDSAP